MSQPNNVYMSFQHLAKLVDEIWYLAGDKSADVCIKLTVQLINQDTNKQPC